MHSAECYSSLFIYSFIAFFSSLLKACQWLLNDSSEPKAMCFKRLKSYPEPQSELSFMFAGSSPPSF